MVFSFFVGFIQTRRAFTKRSRYVAISTQNFVIFGFARTALEREKFQEKISENITCRVGSKRCPTEDFLDRCDNMMFNPMFRVDDGNARYHILSLCPFSFV